MRYLLAALKAGLVGYERGVGEQAEPAARVPDEHVEQSVSIDVASGDRPSVLGNRAVESSTPNGSKKLPAPLPLHHDTTLAELSIVTTSALLSPLKSSTIIALTEPETGWKSQR